MSQPWIRPARLEDAEALDALVNSAYRGDSSRRGWTTEADLLGGQRTDPESLGELMGDAANVILLLEDSKHLLGCVLIRNKVDHGYLGMLTVRPDSQASGHGRRLLIEAERWIRETWNLPRLEMTVIRGRAELIAWYGRRGYRNTGRTEPFPNGDVRFGIPKVPDLTFVVLEKYFES